MSNNSELPAASAVITLRAVLEEFPRLHAFLENLAAEIGMPEHPTGQLLIAADEIFTNIAAYAYAPDSGDVEVAVRNDPAERRVTVTFSDRGKPFDPLAGPDPDVTAPLAERPIGGLGIFVVKKLMDHVEYRRDHGCNRLTLTKYFGDKEAPSCG